jgi:ribonuclease T2
MKWIKLLCRALVAAPLFLSAVPSQARNRDFSADDFDYFLLNLSIAPGFCALSPTNRATDECRSLTEADFRQTPLTVHGLWPNRTGVSVNRQPHDCQGAPFGLLPQPVQAGLRRYMPGGPGLERYEWRKHGACSGLSPEAYFATVVRLAQHANETIGAVMRDQQMLGHLVRVADLLAAVGSIDPALESAIVVDCRKPHGGGETLIDGVRVVLWKDFRPMPASIVGLGQNSGCAQGRGLVPDVSR